MSILETLEICFTANLRDAAAQLDGLAVQLRDVTAASSAMRPAGAQLASHLRAGLASGIPALLREGRTAADAYASGAQSHAASARSAGSALSAGLASGIRSGRSTVTSAVNSVVNAALSRMRSLLKIHSPSKVTRSFGAYFGEGFADGVSGSVSLAARAAENLSDAALSRLSPASIPAMTADSGISAAVNRAVESALGGVNLTIPLTVDGMKLGEASIRGINAVTKSAGRVLLNI
jgi:hypothetical protein